MKDEPTDPPGDSSGITAESTTRTVTTTYNAPGPQESLLPAYATTATQAVNEHAALRACCSSPDLRQNTTNTGSRPSPTAEPALPLGTILLNGPEMQAPQLRIRRHPTAASHVSRLCLKDVDVIVPRVKRTRSFPSVLPKYPRVRIFAARRRKYGEDTP
ncbi:hypothetical protein MRX96_044875 [Rhipicephalus microplus]